jgi:molybdopterin-guanine dinucleotide biosynthesis protein A
MSSLGTLGVLLAGGQGRRLGLGVPKALAKLGGRTFLERALEALRGACGEVVVALPPSIDLPLEGAARVDDVAPDAGPLAGMIAGLASRPFHCAMVLGVDYPLMRASVLKALIAMFEEERTHNPNLDALVPVIGGRVQPLAGVYAPSALPVLKGEFDRGMRAVVPAVGRLMLLRCDEPRLVAALGDAAALTMFAHVNTPEDLGMAESR